VFTLQNYAKHNLCQTLGDELFFLPHIILGVGKHHDLINKKWQTIGDALMLHNDLLDIPCIVILRFLLQTCND
jgi:hypothetical protein